MSQSMRMSWVDTAKGLSIILVVAMYAAYNTGEYTGQVGVLHYLIGFATPFRMPEFFLISGLFLSQVIARPWQRYADRRVLHYFYFYALWAVIMIVLKVGLFARAPVDMLQALALAVVEPYGVLWFIYMLGIFSVPSNCSGSCACRTGWLSRSPPACRWRTSMLPVTWSRNSPAILCFSMSAMPRHL